jgi:xanthine dehydrogenase accessory factor
MDWLAAVEGLRARRVSGVIVTLAAVRGHSPRNGGAKMVVSADDIWGTVGGGNLEATAVRQARTMIRNHSPEPSLVKLALDDKAPADFGIQCCGGEVTMLLEPVPVVPSVAIFGMGHVGAELARILSRHDLELFMIDSRADMLTDDRLAGLADGSARLQVRHAAVPESVFPDLPPGTHVMIMTHDHAEDIALCDYALRHPELAFIGLIGSEMKWARFRRRLTAEGHSAQDLERITTPIGIPGIRAKEPAAIAVSAAAGLLVAFERLNRPDLPPRRHKLTDPEEDLASSNANLGPG